MRLQHSNSQRWKVTLKRDELNTLMSAAEWILNDQKGKIPPVARKRLKTIVEGYHAECDRLYKASQNPSLPHSEEEK